MKLAYLVSLVLVAAACGDGGGDADPNLVRQDEASDEAWRAIVDAVDRGEVTVSDANAAQLTAPADLAVLPAGTPATFTWSLPSQRPRHGVDDGEFVWLHLEDGGLTPAIDVVSITTTSWTPDATLWARISTATGPIQVTVTNAFMVDGIVMEGPFRATAATTSFTIQGS